MPPGPRPLPKRPSRIERMGAFAARAGGLRPADPNARRALYAGIATVVLLGVVLAVAGAVEELPHVDWSFRPGWIAVAVVSLAVYLIAATQIWRRLLGRLGPRLGARPATAIWFSSALGRYVPTALLLPVMRMAMAEREGAPKRVTLVSVVYEVALTLIAAIVVGAYFIIELPDLEGEPARFLVLVIPVFAIAALHPAIFHRFTDFALERLGRDPLPVSLSVRGLLGFLAMYAALYVIAGASLYGISECVYPAVGPGDAVTLVGAFAVGTAVSLVAFILPGGLVAREAAMTVALAPVMPTAPAVAVAVLSRMLQIGLEVVLAAFTQPWLRRSPE